MKRLNITCITLPLLILLLTLSACTQNPLALSTHSSKSAAFSGTYLFVGACHNRLAQPEQVKGLFTSKVIASLAGSALKTGIDWLGNALQKAAKDDIYSTTVSTNIKSIEQLNTESNTCMQIVRGQFTYAHSTSAHDNAKTDSSDDKVFTNNLALDTDKFMGAPVKLIKGSEELFIEILPVVQQQVVSFVPLEVRYSGYTPQDRHNKQPRDLALFVGYAPVNKDIHDGKFSGRLINFGTLTPSPNKPASRKFVSQDGKISSVKQTQWLPLDQANGPLSLAVQIIETRKASRFSQFLAEVFDSSKADIKRQAETALAELKIFKTSKELEQEKLALEQKQIEQEGAYFEAEARVISATNALTSLCQQSTQPDKNAVFTAQKTLYLAKRKANLAAEYAGKKRPYTSIQLPTGQCATW